MKRFSLKHGMQIAAVVILGLAAFSPGLRADEYNRQTVFTISETIEVPGAVLQPGTYVMRLFNSPSNRNIVQFMTEDRKQQLALTFAVPAERLERVDKPVLTMYEGARGAPPALRTWFFAGETSGREFLYPKKQAATISARTNQKVPEIDETPALSDSSNITAAASVQNATPSEPLLVARTQPAPEPIPAPIAAAPGPQQPAAPVANALTNENSAAVPADESLPQTASYGPLAGLIGGVSLAFAWGVRWIKRSGVRS